MVICTSFKIEFGEASEKKKIDFHGYIKIYTLVYFTEDVCYQEDAKSMFVELNLKFTDGVLVLVDWLQPTSWVL